MSDSQSVPSHPLRPDFKVPVPDHSPIPDPCTVTLNDPVPPTFARLITLSCPVSSENASVTLPSRTPTVAVKILLPLSPPLARQCKEVSDRHVERSQAVLPTRATELKLNTPNPPPYMVTLADPDDIAFGRTPPLNSNMSLEIDSEPVPVRIPTVIDSLLDPSVP